MRTLAGRCLASCLEPFHRMPPGGAPCTPSFREKPGLADARPKQLSRQEAAVSPLFALQAQNPFVILTLSNVEGVSPARSGAGNRGAGSSPLIRIPPP